MCVWRRRAVWTGALTAPCGTDADRSLAQVAMGVVMDGLRLEEPDKCVSGLYAIMQKTWIADVEQRATFLYIEQALLEIEAGVDRLDTYWVPAI